MYGFVLSFTAQGEDKALEQRVFIHTLDSTGIFSSTYYRPALSLALLGIQKQHVAQCNLRELIFCCGLLSVQEHLENNASCTRGAGIVQWVRHRLCGQAALGLHPGSVIDQLWYFGQTTLVKSQVSVLIRGWKQHLHHGVISKIPLEDETEITEHMSDMWCSKMSANVPNLHHYMPVRSTVLFHSTLESKINIAIPLEVENWGFRSEIPRFHWLTYWLAELCLWGSVQPFAHNRSLKL